MKTSTQHLIIVLLVLNLVATLWVGVNLCFEEKNIFLNALSEKSIPQRVKSKLKKLLIIPGEIAGKFVSKDEDANSEEDAPQALEESVAEEKAEEPVVTEKPEDPVAEEKAEEPVVAEQAEEPVVAEQKDEPAIEEKALAEKQPEEMLPQLSPEEKDAQIDILCLELRKKLAEGAGEPLVIAADSESSRFSFQNAGTFTEENEMGEAGEIKRYIFMSTNGRKDIFYKENIQIEDGEGNTHNVSVRYSLDFNARREGKVNIHGTYFWEIIVDGAPHAKVFAYTSTPYASPYRKLWIVDLPWGALTVKCGNADWLLTDRRAQALEGSVEISTKLSDGAIEAAVQAFREKCKTSESLPETAVR